MDKLTTETLLCIMLLIVVASFAAGCLGLFLLALARWARPPRYYLLPAKPAGGDAPEQLDPEELAPVKISQR